MPFSYIPPYLYSNERCELYPTRGRDPQVQNKGLSNVASAPYNLKRRFVRIGEMQQSCPTSAIKGLDVNDWIPFTEQYGRLSLVCSANPAYAEHTHVSPELQLGITPIQSVIAERLSPTFARISGFLRLQRNWDSYGSGPPPKKSVANATCLLAKVSDLAAQSELSLPTPFAAPRSDGGIQFEWETDDRYLEVTVLPDSTEIEYYKSDERSEFEEEGIIGSDAELEVLLRWLIKAPINVLLRTSQEDTTTDSD